jgi:hypothetical protein
MRKEENMLLSMLPWSGRCILPSPGWIYHWWECPSIYRLPKNWVPFPHRLLFRVHCSIIYEEICHLLLKDVYFHCLQVHQGVYWNICSANEYCNMLKTLLSFWKKKKHMWYIHNIVHTIPKLILLKSTFEFLLVDSLPLTFFNSNIILLYVWEGIVVLGHYNFPLHCYSLWNLNFIFMWWKYARIILKLSLLCSLCCWEYVGYQ